MSEPKIITFTGPSGAGKTSIVRELLKLRPQLSLITSLTTRPRRDNDLPNEYQYLSSAEFAAYPESDFLWKVRVHYIDYGTLKSSVDAALQNQTPKNSIMILVPDVLEKLIAYTQNQVLPIYILPPPEDVLRERLKKRGDTDEAIEKRIADCREWNDRAKKSLIPYRFIENDWIIDAAVAKVLIQI